MQLAAYLDQNDIKRVDFARKIGVSPQLITGYCDGTIWPSKDKANIILAATNGEVTPSDFAKTIRRERRPTEAAE